ncbi:thiolase family protein [Siphonobacter sp. SORGH_AS_1065]|uniref:thiolase family protein n=1 Tax=Siphonobacter sp. SORGH_AS_1065 TaxID=3041795 RepID=UPI00278121C9|nr:thiolase family protein [Siphonobacter sp. SORGH_AS_1065]MDQ1088274.1 acetyl-CoA C-acetyltransferase [Siphonobacter sp. SORGH_AS_1065]
MSAYIVEGFRLPTGKANGYYKTEIPERLMAEILREFLRKHPSLSVTLDEVMLGNALGTGGNMARYALLEAGLPVAIPATTIDMQCGAGLRSVIMAEAQLRSGMSQCVIAGGMESNSLAPRRQYHTRDFRYQDEDTYYTQATFAPESWGDSRLTEAARLVAETYGITKEEMIRWTLRSHQLASQSEQLLKEIRLPYQNFFSDQPIRKNLLESQLWATQTSALIDHTNTAHLHDGAAGVLLINAPEKADFQPKFRIVASALAGGGPTMAPAGVIWATERLLSQSKRSIQEIDLFEINESFAVKPLAFMRHWNISEEKVNIFGGNLAYGHPFGASGIINLIHLMRALEHTRKRFGLVTVGVAGGLGIALMIENLNA